MHVCCLLAYYNLNAHRKKKKNKIQVFEPEELAAIYPPGRFLRVIATKTKVFEIDRKEYENKHGVGPAFGTIVDPFGGEIMCDWDDGDHVALPKKNLAVAPQKGETFVSLSCGTLYRCVRYSEAGCHLEAMTSKSSAPKRKRVKPQKEAVVKKVPKKEAVVKKVQKEKEQQKEEQKKKGQPQKEAVAKKEEPKKKGQPQKKAVVKKVQEDLGLVPDPRVGATNIQMVDKEAFAKFQELSDKAMYVRDNADKLDATEFAETSTCAYEEATRLQKQAHIHYMAAIGLGEGGSKKKKRRPATNKKKNQKTRSNPARATKKQTPTVPLQEQQKSEPLRGKKKKGTTQTWSKCRDPELTDTQLNKLGPALDKNEGGKYFQPRFSRAKYYAFAHRVCRAYHAEWVRQDSDVSHINRENLTRSAVASVFGQVRPWSDKPHHGNTYMATVALLPVIQVVFDIPSYAFKPGSEEWFHKVTTLNRFVRCSNVTSIVTLTLLP